MDAKTFNQDLKETLTKLKVERLAEDRHPASETLLAFAEQTLDPETTEHVRMHTFFCHACRNDLYGLKAVMAEERLVEASGEVEHKPSINIWREFIQGLKD